MKAPVKYLRVGCVICCCFNLWGCDNITKTQDCQKYELAMAETANIPFPATEPAKNKQSFVRSLNAIADGQEKMGEMQNAVKLQDVKLKEIQKQTFIASNELANYLRLQAASIDALPGEPTLEEIQAVITRNRNPQFQRNWQESNDKFLEYCLGK